METYERTLRKLRKCLYIYIGETPRGDLGIFAAKSFQFGDLIMADEDGDYYDNVHTAKEIIRRGLSFDRTLQVGADRFKLANGSIDDFTNHSCTPNTGIRLTPKGTKILAIRDIEPHDELTYDYSTYLSNPYEILACTCGAGNCRRLIGSFRTLPQELKQAYLALDIVGAFARDDQKEGTRSGTMAQV